jgi:hypothetical protein
MPSLKDLSKADIDYLITIRDNDIVSNEPFYFPNYGTLVGRDVLALAKELDERTKKIESTDPFDVSMLVPHTYMMNPETDEIVPSGFELLNGMSVLIENSNRRSDLKYFTDDLYKASRSIENYNAALEWNRWCEVTHLTIWNNETVTFVGVYDDGVKIQRRVPVEHAWLVWIDSLPDLRVEQLDEALKPKYITTGRKTEVPKMTNDTTFPEDPTFFNSPAPLAVRDKMATDPTYWTLQDVEANLRESDSVRQQRAQWMTSGYSWKSQYPDVPQRNFDQVLIDGPPKVSWNDFDIDEIDDLVRWRNSHIGNPGDIEMIRDEMEVTLNSGKKIFGMDLRELFRKESKRQVVDKDKTPADE